MGGRGSSSGKSKSSNADIKNQLAGNKVDLDYAQMKYSEYAKAANYTNKARDGMDAWGKEVKRLQEEREQLQQEQNKSEIKNIQDKIDALTAQNANLLKREYSGKRGWGKQLDSDIKKAKDNNAKIQKLESQKKKLQQGAGAEKEKTKSKQSTSPQWQKAGDGWYVGSNGYEIRQNYSTGGFDVVKTNKNGDVIKKVKSFSKLSQARKYNP